jgi:uncharacterized membrane protein YgcG
MDELYVVWAVILAVVVLFVGVLVLLARNSTPGTGETPAQTPARTSSEATTLALMMSMDSASHHTHTPSVDTFSTHDASSSGDFSGGGGEGGDGGASGSW